MNDTAAPAAGIAAGVGAGAPVPSMGRGDFLLFLLATGISLRWISAAAGAGPSSLVFWGLASLAFQIPLCLCVLELTTRFPGEGGMYRWSLEAFGERAAFMTGWLYWASNLSYFPAILYFTAGNALWIDADRWRYLENDPRWFVGFSAVVLLLATWMNVIGLRRGKWLTNIGAIGTWLPVLLLLALAWVAVGRTGSATDFLHADWIPAHGIRDLAFWSTIVFAFGGSETASFILPELRRPQRDLRFGLLVAGVAVLAAYLLGTFAMLLLLPSVELRGLGGIMQAIAAGAARADALWLVAPLAALVALGNIGTVSAWFTATARLPLVGGMDGYLPPRLGALHPRHGTPSVSLWWMFWLSSGVVLLGQAGASVKGAYDVLVAMTTIAYFIPYLYAFAALIRVQGLPSGAGTVRVPGGPRVAQLMGVVGFLTTSVTIALSLVPAPDEPRPWLAVGKVLGLSAVLVGVGAVVGWRRRWGAVTPIEQS